MKEQDKYLILIHKRLTNQLSSEEAQELNTWLESKSEHRVLLERTTKSWEASLQYKSDYQPDTNSEWRKLSDKIGEGKVVAMPTRRYRWVATAAILLLIGSAFWLINNTTNTVENWVEIQTNDTTKDLQLPDGSTVFLNKNTYLAYRENFNNKEERTIKMTGEAFFEVTKNVKPFIVRTDKVDVRVLGTSFNVHSNAAEVTVQSGKVQVSDKPNKQKIILQKGGQARLNTNGTLQKTSPKNLNTLAWKTRQLEFNATPLKEALDQLEEYYDVKIDDTELKINCLHTGDVIESDEIQEVFEGLKRIHKVKIIKTDTGYKITEGKC